jgi:hypothetical protein
VRPLIPITRITDLGVASAHPMFLERERESECVYVGEREGDENVMRIWRKGLRRK